MEPIHTNRLHVNIQTNFKDASKKYLWCILFLVCRTRMTPTTRIFIFKEHEFLESTECGLNFQARNSSYRAHRAHSLIWLIRVRKNSSCLWLKRTRIVRIYRMWIKPSSKRIIYSQYLGIEFIIRQMGIEIFFSLFAYSGFCGNGATNGCR